MIARSRRSDALVAWAACCIALAVGADAGIVRLGAAIDAQRERLVAIGDAIQRESAAARAVPLLRARAARERAALGPDDAGNEHRASTSRFVRAAEAAATAAHATVVSLAARAVMPSGTAQLPAGRAADAADAFTLELTLRGSYRAVLTTVAALAAAPLALRIAITGIERAAGARASDDLIAHLEVRAVEPDAPIALTSSLGSGTVDARSR